MRVLIAVGVLAASIFGAQAQGIIGGVEQGASDGARAAGPVGAVVGAPLAELRAAFPVFWALISVLAFVSTL